MELIALTLVLIVIAALVLRLIHHWSGRGL